MLVKLIRDLREYEHLDLLLIQLVILLICGGLAIMEVLHG